MPLIVPRHDYFVPSPDIFLGLLEDDTASQDNKNLCAIQLQVFPINVCAGIKFLGFYMKILRNQVGCSARSFGRSGGST